MLDRGVAFIDARVDSTRRRYQGREERPLPEKSAKAVDFDRTQDQFDLRSCR